MRHEGKDFDCDRENRYAANFNKVNEVKLVINCSRSIFSLDPSCIMFTLSNLPFCF